MNMDHTTKIIELLNKVEKKEKSTKQFFKARAYRIAIQNIENLEKPILNIDDIKGVKGIGPKIREKIDEIIKTGHLKVVDKYDDDPSLKIIDSLLKIHGIGIEGAKKLVKNNNIKSIDDLMEKQSLLNDTQKMGLKYYQDFNVRIPRAEMNKHNTYIQNIVVDIDPEMKIEIVGSYRRKEKDSGDIDVLLTHSNDDIGKEQFVKIISRMRHDKYITDIFANGNKKLMGVCRLKRHKKYRRIDMLYTKKETFPYAQMFFTGDQFFNVMIRKNCIKKKLSLSEYGLKRKDGTFVEGLLTEKAIMNYLEYEYIEPENRNAKALNIKFHTKKI